MGEQRLQFRAEQQRGVALCVIEWLNPGAVAYQHEALAPAVPQRDREHAAQAVGEIVAILLVEVDDDLAVRMMGTEAVALCLELSAQLDMVVDLAVEHGDNLFVLGKDRLFAGLDVDDGKAPHTK